MPVFNVWVLTPRGERCITLTRPTADHARAAARSEGYTVRKVKLVRSAKGERQA